MAATSRRTRRRRPARSTPDGPTFRPHGFHLDADPRAPRVAVDRAQGHRFARGGQQALGANAAGPAVRAERWRRRTGAPRRGSPPTRNPAGTPGAWTPSTAPTPIPRSGRPPGPRPATRRCTIASRTGSPSDRNSTAAGVSLARPSGPQQYIATWRCYSRTGMGQREPARGANRGAQPVRTIFRPSPNPAGRLTP